MTKVNMDAKTKVTRSGPPASREHRLSVAFLVEGLTTPGGTERQCIELARQLKRDGHEIVILTVEGSLSAHEPDDIDSRIPQIVIGRSPPARFFGMLHPKLGQAWEMIRLGWAASRLPRKVLLMAHHYPAHWAAFVAARFGSRAVIWLCNDWIHQPLARRRNAIGMVRVIRRRAMILLDGFVARRFTAVLALSCRTATQITQGYRVRTAVFRTGATGAGPAPAGACQRMTVRHALNVPSDAYLISCVCILMPHRRVEDIIRAVGRLRQSAALHVYLVHIGGASKPELLERLQTLAQDQGVATQIRFLGAVSETERRSIVAASDAFVFPVEGQSWGLAPLEAMAAGVPTIVSTSSGVAEVLRPTRDALLYEPGDIDSLASHLRHLHNSVEEAARLGRRGQERWETRFTWRHAAARLARQLARHNSYLRI